MGVGVLHGRGCLPGGLCDVTRGKSIRTGCLGFCGCQHGSQAPFPRLCVDWDRRQHNGLSPAYLQVQVVQHNAVQLILGLLCALPGLWQQVNWITRAASVSVSPMIVEWQVVVKLMERQASWRRL